jgi:hypothetical protein
MPTRLTLMVPEERPSDIASISKLPHVHQTITMGFKVKGRKEKMTRNIALIGLGIFLFLIECA